MAKKEYHVLRWLEGSHEQDTPVLFIGQRVRTVKLEVGMTIYHIDEGLKYRLDAMSFKDERDEKNGVHQLSLTTINNKGVEGKQKVGYSTNSFLAVWQADIAKEHQELFYGNQDVNGTIKDGVFQPAEEYLVDWHGMFMKYFDILRAHPYRGQSEVDSEMPQLVRKCIEQFGAGVFNALVREHYAGKENREETFHEAWSSLFKHDWLYYIDPKLSFPSRVLESTINMSSHFDDAVRTVVFKDGIKLDISKLIG